MIKFLRRKQIDIRKWNKTVLSSPQRLIYFESWFLDSMTDKCWNALVYGNYEYLMPLPYRVKYGMQYIYQPFITQRLGVIGQDIAGHNTVNSFLKAVPIRYLIVNQSVVADNVTNYKYNVTLRNNHIINLIKGYSAIKSAYSRNTVRNLNVAYQSGLTVSYNIGFDKFIDFHCQHEVYQFTKPNLEHINMLINNSQTHAKAFAVGVYYSDNLVAAGLFIVDTQRVYFLLCSSSAVGRSKRAMFLLIDSVIQTYAGKKLIFDFTGSSLPTIARRNEGFGSETEHYNYIVRKSIVQWLFNKFNL